MQAENVNRSCLVGMLTSEETGTRSLFPEGEGAVAVVNEGLFFLFASSEWELAVFLYNAPLFNGRHTATEAVSRTQPNPRL